MIPKLQYTTANIHGALKGPEIFSLHAVRSLSKVYDDDTHIVAAFTFSSVEVGRQQRIQKTLTDLGQLDFALHLDVNVVNDLLTRLGLPYTVTADDGKVRPTRHLMDLDVRKSCNSLLVQLQLGILLVSDVTDGARQVQITVNTTFEVDGRTSPVDTITLLLHRGLMINTHREGAATLAEDATRVTSIRTVEQIVGKQEHVGRAALTFHHLDAVLVLLDLAQGGLVGVETESALHR